MHTTVSIPEIKYYRPHTCIINYTCSIFLHHNIRSLFLVLVSIHVISCTKRWRKESVWPRGLHTCAPIGQVMVLCAWHSNNTLQCFQLPYNHSPTHLPLMHLPPWKWLKSERDGNVHVQWTQCSYNTVIALILYMYMYMQLYHTLR